MTWYIRPNHTTRHPANHMVVDCETIPVPQGNNPGVSIHRLLIGVAHFWRYEGMEVTREDRRSFEDTNSFWRFLMEKLDAKRPTYVWAHNAGFDFSVLGLWSQIERGTFSFGGRSDLHGARPGVLPAKKPWRGACVTGDPPTIVVVRDQKGRTVKFLDTLNWAMARLEDIGQQLDFPKLPMPGESASLDDWEAYCARDVDITVKLVRSIIDVVNEQDMGVFKATAAGQSKALWRHRCLDCPVLISSDPKPKELERRSYYGGRTLVHFAGAVLRPEQAAFAPLHGVPENTPVLPYGPVHVLDVTGAYPSAMADHIYPVKLLSCRENLHPDQLLRAMNACAACAEVLVDDQIDTWPRRDKENVYHDRGKFWTVLCGPELLRALQSGIVRSTGRVQLYQADRPFVAFTKATWQARRHYQETGRPLHARLMKTIANALHGKFAQKSFNWSDCPGKLAPLVFGQFYEIDPQTRVPVIYRALGDLVQVQTDRGEKEDSFPLIAAYCASYAREAMRSIRQQAGINAVVYEDIDTIHVLEHGYRELVRVGLVEDNALGKLHLVGTHDKAIYRGPKDYSLDDLRVTQGLSRKAVQDARGLWHQTNFMRLDGLLLNGAPIGPVSSDRSLATPVPQIRGQVMPDGWVQPRNVSGWKAGSGSGSNTVGVNGGHE